MSWQDLAFGIGQIVLNITLIPVLRSKTHKPPLTTSIGHGAVMVVFTIAYASLGFWFAPLMAAIEAVLWFWIATHHRRVASKPLLVPWDGWKTELKLEGRTFTAGHDE